MDADVDLVVVLAAHGAPAKDYPRWRVGVMMALEMGGAGLGRLPGVNTWRQRLVAEVCGWPRTPTNDPYKAAVDELAGALSAQLQCRVLAGYNEFCAPDIPAALDQAAAEGARRVVVIPTMLLRGNEHTEAEIAAAVAAARQRHPGIQFVYAWPFELTELVGLFSRQIRSRGGPP
jgi:sirohydrochlorin cobaltochelatase